MKREGKSDVKNEPKGKTQALKRAPKIIAPTNIDGRKTVSGAGFSHLELERAGLSMERAAELGLRIDLDRCSALGSNVVMLKRLIEAMNY